MNKKYEGYIQNLNEKMLKNQDEIENYKLKLEKINIQNKIDYDKKIKYNDTLEKYQQIIKNERDNVNNANSVISRLRAELDYYKEENLKLLKNISENNRTTYINKYKKLKNEDEKENDIFIQQNDVFQNKINNDSNNDNDNDNYDYPNLDNSANQNKNLKEKDNNLSLNDEKINNNLINSQHSNNSNNEDINFINNDNNEQIISGAFNKDVKIEKEEEINDSNNFYNNELINYDEKIKDENEENINNNLEEV